MKKSFLKANDEETHYTKTYLNESTGGLLVAAPPADPKVKIRTTLVHYSLLNVLSGKVNVSYIMKQRIFPRFLRPILRKYYRWYNKD